MAVALVRLRSWKPSPGTPRSVPTRAAIPAAGRRCTGAAGPGSRQRRSGRPRLRRRLVFSGGRDMSTRGSGVVRVRRPADNLGGDFDRAPSSTSSALPGHRERPAQQIEVRRRRRSDHRACGAGLRCSSSRPPEGFRHWIGLARHGSPSRKVNYHRETAMARGDDHRRAALEYCVSRGETPLVWGCSGALPSPTSKTLIRRSKSRKGSPKSTRVTPPYRFARGTIHSRSRLAAASATGLDRSAESVAG
jgi:hypothetical protein